MSGNKPNNLLQVLELIILAFTPRRWATAILFRIKAR